MNDPKESKTSGYHLFLEPENSLRGELQDIIITLAEEQGSPSFPPHVALLARIPAEPVEVLSEKCRTLASQLEPFELSLGELGAEEKYFKALYVQILEHAVAEAHEKAYAVFGMKDEAPYAAHLSLLYGNYEPAAIEEIKAKLIYPKGVNFTVRKLHLYKTEGEASVWKKIAEFPF